MYEQWQLHWTRQQGGRCCWVSMCTVWLSYLKWSSRVTNLDQRNVQDRTFLCGNYLGDSEGCSYEQLVIGSFFITRDLLMHHVSCRVFWWNIKSLRWLSPLEARFGTLWILAFPKTKITFEREEISDHWWDSWKYNGAADGENCVRLQGAFFKGDWGIVVLCTMFLVSSSINVFVFHSTWLDTFWTDLTDQLSIAIYETTSKLAA